MTIFIAAYDDFRNGAFFGCYPLHGMQRSRMHPSDAATPHFKVVGSSSATLLWIG